MERAVPIMPTFVFAKAGHVPELVRLADDPRKAHEDFSVFHYFGRIPIIADVELESLRSEENRVAPKQKQRVYGEGETVRIPEGSFAGMTGIVEGGDARFTFVCFGGNVRVKISTFLLRQDGVDGLQSATQAAAA